MAVPNAPSDGDPHEAVPVPILRQRPVFREPHLRALRAPSGLPAGDRRALGTGAFGRRLDGTRRPRPHALPLRQRRARRLQLADAARERRALLPGLPPQRHHPRREHAGESRALAADGVRKAPALLRPAALEPAPRHPRRGPGARADLQLPLRPAGGRRTEGDDRPRERRHHHRPDRGGRRRARIAPARHGRALPHPRRPFPPRGRPSLLGPLGARRRPPRRLPGGVRRRQPGLRGRPQAPLRGGHAARLAAALGLGLRDHASLGRTSPRPGRTTSTSSTRWRWRAPSAWR